MFDNIRSNTQVYYCLSIMVNEVELNILRLS